MTEKTGQVFEHTQLQGSRLREVDLRGSDFRNVAFNGSVMRGAELEQVTIDGAIDGLVINGVEVAPLVEAVLDERYPDRVKMRPNDAAGCREAWDLIEQLWDGTVARARRLDPALLHEQVDEEWSFVQTLRHLLFATDAWIRRTVLGEPSPWHQLDLPWDGMKETPGIPWDRTVRPELDEVLALRADRMATVRRFVDDLTDDQLRADTAPVTGAGWPPPDSYPVRECLLIVLNEEWQHRLYAERDLTTLESTSA